MSPRKTTLVALALAFGTRVISMTNVLRGARAEEKARGR
jgi:hypothetical protein